MLAKCVHHQGIERKQVIKFEDYKGYEIYTLKEDVKQKYSMKYIMYDSHLFPAVSDIEIIRQILNNINFNFKEHLIKTFDEQIKLKSNINMGFAEYLNRVEEAKEVKTQQKKEWDLKDKERQLLKEKREQERIKQEQEAFQKAEEDFKNGEYIYGREFVDLCDKYNIKLPIRTRGWCLNSLTYVSNNHYGYRGKHHSTVIMKYAKLLKEAVST